jgi:hypothetical protein
MFADHSPELSDHWDILQQPTCLSNVDPLYLLLLAALDRGWHVQEPVYLRSRWSDDGPRVYHFILNPMPPTAGAPPRLISVPEGPEVERFVREAGLSVALR